MPVWDEDEPQILTLLLEVLQPMCEWLIKGEGPCPTTCLGDEGSHVGNKNGSPS